MDLGIWCKYGRWFCAASKGLGKEAALKRW